jgi:diguanylate cyclase (GGDEF)-like protein/PAS domain S-box-containing protein
VERPDEDRIEATLAWLRRAHPGARLTANEPGVGRVPVPSSLGFPPEPILPPGAPVGLELVVPRDRARVLRAFERCRVRGIASVTADFVNGEHVQIHFIDATEAHGVVLIAAVPDDASIPPPEEETGGGRVAPLVTWARLDGNAHVIEVDAGFEAVFGWLPEDIYGKNALPFLHPDDHDAAFANWIDVMASPGQKRRFRCRHVRRDGSYCWVDTTNTNRLDDPEHGDVLCEHVDISEEMQVHEELRQREQLLRELTDALPVGVVHFDGDRRAVHENEQLRTIVGRSGLEGLLDAVVDDAQRAELDAAVDAVLAGSSPSAFEVRLTDGRVCRVTVRPLLGTGGLACVDDITEAAQLRAELEERATFDSLTSCYSRAAILGALDVLNDDGPGTGVVFVDLDRFKPVNDELGHAAGDELLAVIGDRLRAAVREVDLVGRLGGDEFLVVCPGVPDAGVVEVIARRIGNALTEPMELGDAYLVRPRASIGVAWAPAGTDPDELVARADAAMYVSKRQPVDEPNSPTKLTISPG